MSRTNARFEQDLPFTDGVIVLSPIDFGIVGAAGPVLTLNASGDVSINQGASLAAKYVASLNNAIYRLGMQPFLQERFGTAAGVAGPTSVAGTSDPDALVGVPPFTGNVGITPTSGFIAKGIAITDVVLYYLITGAALTLHTMGITKTVKPTPGTPAALVVTNVLANAANGLATATNANPQSTLAAATSQVFQVTDNTELILEVDASTQVAGAYRLYGAEVHCRFNLN